MFSACHQKNKIEPVQYPETKKCDTVDHYFGTAVPDPYRWLEDDYSDRCYGFPVRVSALEKLMADDAAAISYRIDEDGEFELDDEGEQIERARSSWYSPEWRRHYEYALTDAQRAKLLQIIENAV